MNNETSKKLFAANYIMLAVLVVQCLIFPLAAFVLIKNSKAIFSGMSIALPVPTRIILSTPIWAYFACAYAALAVLATKEFLLKIDSRILINTIAMIIIQFVSLIGVLGLILPLFEIQHY